MASRMGLFLGSRVKRLQRAFFRARALRFLALALTAEVVGVDTIVWQILSVQSGARRIFAAIGVSVVVSVGTFAILRP